MVVETALPQGGLEGLPPLHAAVRGIGLRPVFQPIVDLSNGLHTGYEALARWPAAPVNPDKVFAYAADIGHADRLDQLCMTAAIEAGLAAGLPTGMMLAVNCEPASTYRGCDRELILARGKAAFSLVFELTERCLLAHPRALLAKVEAIRTDGFSIALDDVGAHTDSLTLLDVLRPEIVKLDLGLIQSRPGREQSRTLAAVLAYRERTGAVVVAEGIEDDSHLERALALGASLGQGYKFGHPQPLHSWTPVSWTSPDLPGRPQPLDSASSPFDLLTCQTSVRTARKEILIALSRHVERQASDTIDPPMILSVLRSEQRISTAMALRYQQLAQTAPLVALFGCGLAAEPAPGVRGIDLDAADPLGTEWNVVALGAQTAVALIAREHIESSRSADKDRRFDFALTYDRGVVTAAAANLLARIP